MIRKCACTLVLLIAGIGVVSAEEFLAQITKVEGNKISYQKYEKGKKVGDAVTVEVAADAKIADAKRDTATKKIIAGDAIEGGLKNKLFPTAAGDKGINAYFTTSDDNKTVKQLLVVRIKK